MYLFDGHAARRWLPLSRTWSKGLPHSRIRLIRLIRCQWQVWPDLEKGKNKTFQALGNMSSFIPHHVYLLTLSHCLSFLKVSCMIVILLKCLVLNLTCEMERFLNLFDSSHVSIWYRAHKKRLERGWQNV